MRLHDYAASGNCYKVRLLLALRGQEYERVPVDIFAGDTLTDAFAALNPARETPVLALDPGPAIAPPSPLPWRGGALVVPTASATASARASAILWLLAEGTPCLPGDPVQRAQVVQWLFFEQ